MKKIILAPTQIEVCETDESMCSPTTVCQHFKPETKTLFAVCRLFDRNLYRQEDDKFAPLYMRCKECRACARSV